MIITVNGKKVISTALITNRLLVSFSLDLSKAILKFFEIMIAFDAVGSVTYVHLFIKIIII